ncbi:MAG: ATP-binding protein [Candidatus Lokiarchaeota archaeon]|nr:ATP-binding protein [Candidatus Lokiarchaeota archaeon]
MIPRKIEKKLKESAQSYPVIALTGPRQSGKTTLVKAIFGNDYKYVNLENIELRTYAKNDPKAFLEENKGKLIIDEAQHVPDLFSYIQVMVDENNKPGQFILTGSQNFLLLEKISQSLAGRVSIFHLLPLSLTELKQAYIPSDLEELLFKGFYPRIYDKNLEPKEWYSNYLHTYVERDVRTLKNINDLGTFQTFLKMCAARTGQLLDLTSIGNDCGISHNTVKDWINILEASFIIFLLRPHFKNFNKRLIKSPKIYFYDTGLLCHLLGIESKEQIKTHYLRGGIFESFIISEIIKIRTNKNVDPNVFFWRDKYGHEIDCIIENQKLLTPYEIKSAKTINDNFFENLNYWNNLSKNTKENTFIIYAGNENQKRSAGNIISWQNIASIFN